MRIHVILAFTVHIFFFIPGFLLITFVLNLATERSPPANPCVPSPCGPNAECRERNGAGACYCLPGFEGNPYEANTGCRRECEVNNDCVNTLACIGFKCVDPCPGTCGTSATCSVVNHIPTCSCIQGYTGDPFTGCRPIPSTREYFVK